MSSALEPPTTAKVVLHTTKGPIEIELWAKEAPKATRNFIQHCMDGYYDNTIFHRVVPDFLIQGGDPSGTGHGGRSIYADQGGFPSEFHSRLRFNRRGLLGNADGDETNDNSQFFITLAATPELQKKNTMFGRVMGDTIYNVLKIAEAELDKNERPLYPAKVTHTEILTNYFDDMKPKRATGQADEGHSATKKKVKSKARVKMSFMDDEKEEGEDTVKQNKFKMKSAHEILKDSRLSNTSDVQALVTVPPAEQIKPEPKTESKESKVVPKQDPKTEKRTKRQLEIEPVATAPVSSEFDKINAEIAAMKASMKRKAIANPQKEFKKLSALDAERENYIKVIEKGVSKKQLRMQNEADTMAKLRAFTDTLKTASQERPQPLKLSKQADGDKNDEEKLCDLHNLPNCQSCMYYDALSEGEDVDPSSLWTHTFVDEKSLHKRPTRVPSPPPPTAPVSKTKYERHHKRK
ncbi:peptidyl-prolyl isomerase cwc27 [Lipomyces arxii]|uniref:peptidyl-prolyl isomerase cwc27 n=1 Tax=Lipomyces arxii TaxID=56418 RepID=UPI0034CFE52C